MLKEIYNNLLNEAEKKIEKKCETCLDYIVCWSSETLKEEACNNWRPDFEEIQRAIEEIQAK